MAQNLNNFEKFDRKENKNVPIPSDLIITREVY